VATEYDVDLWIDANGNGQYDNPSDGPDKGYRVVATSTEQGLDATIELANASAEAGTINVGAP
jgi:hypothetical protein